MTRTPAPDDPRPAPQPGSSIHSCSGATSVRAHMRFHHLPDDDAQCAWYAMLPEPPPASRLEGAHSADWIVLGGGLTGLAAARRLAMLRPQSRIALIEAQRIGYGAAGRNSGFMIDLPHHLNSHSYTGRLEADRRLIRRNRAAIDYLRDIVHGHAIECDWREQGKIHAAATNAGAAALAAFMQGLDRLDEPYTQLDRQQLADTTGTDYYVAGMHTPGTVLVQPAALMRGLARSLPENVQVYENSPALSLSTGNDTVRVQCRQGHIEAGGLILATNSFAGQLGLLRGRIIPVSTYASMTPPLTADQQTQLGRDSGWGLIPANPIGTTLRRVQGDRLLVRNTFLHTPAFRTTPAQRRAVHRRHQQCLQARYPELAEAGLEYTWGGVLGASRNAQPYFGRFARGIYAAVCHNGLGLADGTIAGKLIAELACGEDNPLLREMLADKSMPARNPPKPLTTLGVRCQLLWKQWRAGREI